MPIRIKPVIDVGPCVLDLDSIKQICDLVTTELSDVRFSADDDTWEVYDATKDEFITAITPRERLDSFVIVASTAAQASSTGSTSSSGDTAPSTGTIERTVEITFNQYQATIKFTGGQQHERWFSHLVTDVRSHLKAPRFQQRLSTASTGEQRRDEPLSALPTLIIPGVSSTLAEFIFGYAMKAGTLPYSLIILHRQPPNPLWENIKANIISNIIWVILAAVVLYALGALTVWLYFIERSSR